ncbi:MAG: hypothetical protein U0271_14385 [Polyangiaceae bacterium]
MSRSIAVLAVAFALLAGCNFPKNDLVGEWVQEINADSYYPDEASGRATYDFYNDDTYTYTIELQYPSSAETKPGCTERRVESGDYVYRTTGGCEDNDWDGACQSYSTEFQYLTLEPNAGSHEVAGCDDPADDVALTALGPSDFPEEEQYERSINLYNDGSAELPGGLFDKVE